MARKSSAALQTAMVVRNRLQSVRPRECCIAEEKRLHAQASAWAIERSLRSS